MPVYFERFRACRSIGLEYIVWLPFTNPRKRHDMDLGRFAEQRLAYSCAGEWRLRTYCTRDACSAHSPSPEARGQSIIYRAARKGDGLKAHVHQGRRLTAHKLVDRRVPERLSASAVESGSREGSRMELQLRLPGDRPVGTVAKEPEGHRASSSRRVGRAPRVSDTSCHGGCLCPTPPSTPRVQGPREADRSQHPRDLCRTAGGPAYSELGGN